MKDMVNCCPNSMWLAAFPAKDGVFPPLCAYGLTLGYTRSVAGSGHGQYAKFQPNSQEACLPFTFCYWILPRSHSNKPKLALVNDKSSRTHILLSVAKSQATERHVGDIFPRTLSLQLCIRWSQTYDPDLLSQVSRTTHRFLSNNKGKLFQTRVSGKFVISTGDYIPFIYCAFLLQQIYGCCWWKKGRKIIKYSLCTHFVFN
jgi:hypothetical protein